MIASLAIVALSGRGRWRVGAIVLLGVQVVANVVLALSDLLGRDQLTWLQGVSVVATAGWLAALILALAQPRRPSSGNPTAAAPVHQAG